MPRRRKSKPDARAAQALTAIRAGAPDEDAARYAGITAVEWADWLTTDFAQDVEKARADLAVFAAGVVRQAAARDVGVAQRIADRQAAKHELERLRDISGVGD